jgi:hypothetical protein
VSAHKGAAPENADDVPERRSGRRWKPIPSFLEGMQQETIALPVAVQAFCYNDQHETILDGAHPMSLLAKTDGDTMYWDQAMKQHDSAEFLKAAMDEVTSHQENEHWRVIRKEDVPETEPVLDAVWSMERKFRLLANKIYKWKAWLNLQGGQQEHGVISWETYSPVVTWSAIGTDTGTDVQVVHSAD